MELKDLLPTEMQRLTKYPLLIDSVLKHTSRKWCCVSRFVELVGYTRFSFVKPDLLVARIIMSCYCLQLHFFGILSVN